MNIPKEMGLGVGQGAKARIRVLKRPEGFAKRPGTVSAQE